MIIFYLHSKGHCSASHQIFISMLTPLIQRVTLDLWDTSLTEHLVICVKRSLIGFATLNSSFSNGSCTKRQALIVRLCNTSSKGLRIDMIAV